MKASPHGVHASSGQVTARGVLLHSPCRQSFHIGTSIFTTRPQPGYLESVWPKMSGKRNVTAPHTSLDPSGRVVAPACVNGDQRKAAREISLCFPTDCSVAHKEIPDLEGKRGRQESTSALVSATNMTRKHKSRCRNPEHPDPHKGAVQRTACCCCVDGRNLEMGLSR